MKTFRADGQPSRDDECDHGFRRFEKCPHCLDAENERLREALRELLHETEGLFALVHSDPHQTKTVYPRFVLKARSALKEKE